MYACVRACVRRWGRLPGVGPVPVDGVAVGHNLGSQVLAVHTHPKDEDEEEDHFHLRHLRCATRTKPNRLQPLPRLAFKSSEGCGAGVLLREDVSHTSRLFIPATIVLSAYSLSAWKSQSE